MCTCVRTVRYTASGAAVENISRDVVMVGRTGPSEDRRVRKGRKEWENAPPVLGRPDQRKVRRRYRMDKGSRRAELKREEQKLVFVRSEGGGRKVER